MAMHIVIGKKLGHQANLRVDRRLDSSPLGRYRQHPSV